MSETARKIISSLLNRIQFQTHFNTLSSYLDAFSTFISTQFNAAFKTSIFHFIRFRFINTFNQTIALTIPVLVNFLQLKKNDPFTTHPKTMHLAVVSTIIFYILYITLLRFPIRRRFSAIGDQCLHSIGNASAASLASVLFPDSLSPFVFAVFGMLSAAELLHWLYAEVFNDDDEFDVWRTRGSVFFNNIWTAFTDFIGQPLPIQLPV